MLFSNGHFHKLTRMMWKLDCRITSSSTCFGQRTLSKTRNWSVLLLKMKYTKTVFTSNRRKCFEIESLRNWTECRFSWVRRFSTRNISQKHKNLHLHWHEELKSKLYPSPDSQLKNLEKGFRAKSIFLCLYNSAATVNHFENRRRDNNVVVPSLRRLLRIFQFCKELAEIWTRHFQFLS